MRKITNFLRQLFSQFLGQKNKTLFSGGKNVKKATKSTSSDVDTKIKNIQKSTRTSIKMFKPVHEYLSKKYPWYFNWHQKSRTSNFHWLILCIYTTALILMLASSVITIIISTVVYLLGSVAQYFNNLDRYGKDNLEKMSEEEINTQIIAIQKSTKTLFRIFAPLHNKLRMKYRWYYNWHLWSHHELVHALVLIITFVSVSVYGYYVIIYQSKPILASSTATYDYGTASDYSYDSAKIDVTGGKASLKSTTATSTDSTLDFATANEAGYTQENSASGTDFASGVATLHGTAAGNDSDTKLLLHADGTGSSFTDSSPSSNTITANGNTTQSTTESKFGGKSAYFDGSGDYIRPVSVRSRSINLLLKRYLSSVMSLKSERSQTWPAVSKKTRPPLPPRRS